MKPLRFALFFLTIISILPVFAQETQTVIKFPELKTDDLNGKTVNLPKDFPGNPTLVLMAFDSEQQADVDQWIEKMSLKTSDEIAWVEMAVVGSKFRLMKPVIDKGMKKKITTEKERARVLTIYSSRNDLLKKIQIKEQAVDRIYALVINQDGTIRARVEGKPTEENVKTISAALAN